MNKPRNRRPERLLLITPNPNQIPIRTLQTRRQRRAQTRPRTNPNTPLIQRRRIRHTSELELPRPNVRRGIVNEATSKVALDAADEVVVFCVGAFGDDAEGVVFHD